MWRQHVEDNARRIIAKGWHVVWEPWNEPDYWPLGNGSDSEDKAYEQYLQAFLVAYQTIKSLDPKARFSGPSLSADSSIGWAKSRRRLERFLEFCARNNLEVMDLSWHGFDDSKISDYPRRVQEIRQLAATKYPSVNVRRILVSEIVSEDYFYNPGDLIATLKYLDDGGADLVSRACWGNTCWQPRLGGSVRKEGDGIFRTTAMWWANYWYASAIGKRYPGRSTEAGIASVAVLEQQKLSVLLGFSQAAGPQSSQEVVLHLRKMSGVEATSVRVERLPRHGNENLGSPLPYRNFSLRLNADTVLLKLKSVRPGEAYLVSFPVTNR